MTLIESEYAEQQKQRCYKYGMQIYRLFTGFISFGIWNICFLLCCLH